MLKCSNCGAEYAEGNNFCEICGTKLEQIVAQEINVAQPVVPETPVVEEPAAKILVDETPVVEEPATQPAVSEAPIVVDVPVVEQVAAPNPVTEIPVVDIPVVEQVAAPNPVTEIPVVDIPVVEQVAANDGFNVNVSDSSFEFTPEEKPKKKSSWVKLLLAIGIPCVAVVVAAAILLQMFVFKKKEQNYLFYIKDDELFFTFASKLDPRQITDKLYDGDIKANPGNELFQMSRDGKYIFFVDKIEKNDESYELYYCKAKDKKSEPVKLDSEVVCYSISEDGKCVTYLKGGKKSSVLYQHNLKDKTKIAEDVVEYKVSLDGKKIYYYTAEKDLYLKDGKKDAKKISADVDEFVVNNKFDTVGYMKKDTIYKQEGSKDSEKLASEVDEIIEIFDSGEIYYTKEIEKTVNLVDYLDDDLKSSDDAMIQPVEPDEPESWSHYYYMYDDYYMAEDAYNAAWDAYYDAYDAYEEKFYEYEEKLERDELRQEIANAEPVKTYSYELYYHNGKEEKKICDTFGDYEYSCFYDNEVTAKYDTPVLIYTSIKESDVSKIKMSEINYIYDIRDHILYSAEYSAEYYVAVEGNTTLIDTEEKNKYSFKISEDGKTIYYITAKKIDRSDYDDDKYYEDLYAQKGEIYKMSVSGKSVKSAERYDSDVSYYCGFYLIDDLVVYYKDYNEEKGRAILCVNAKEVADDARVYYLDYDSNTETLYFMTDYNNEEDKRKGTLNSYKNGKTVKISDDVHTYDITPTGDVAYLKDYKVDSEKPKGDLYLYNGKKSEKVDDGVQFIVPYFYYSDEITYVGGSNGSFKYWYEREHSEDNDDDYYDDYDDDYSSSYDDYYSSSYGDIVYEDVIVEEYSR